MAVQIAKEVGIHSVAEVAKAMGIKTPLEETPALSLGASDVSLLELVNAYGTVINDGMEQDPYWLHALKTGTAMCSTNIRPKTVQGVPYETAFLMTEMLKAGLTRTDGNFRLFGHSICLTQHRIWR